jgi:hypothetical protein
MNMLNIFTRYVTALVLMSSPRFHNLLNVYLYLFLLIRMFLKLLSVIPMTFMAPLALLLRVVLIYLYLFLNIFII